MLTAASKSLKDNPLAFLILGAIILSFVVNHQQASSQSNKLRADAVASCVRNNERAVLFAAYQQKTSDVRRAAGKPSDIEAADQYQQFALGTMNLIPLPKGVIEDAKMPIAKALILSVERKESKWGETVYAVRPEAKKIIRQGCEQAFAH